MKRAYYYLIASLPMLEFGMKMPFSYNQFLSSCREQLSDCDMGIIQRAHIAAREDIEDASPTLREWKRFDTILRNELVKARANKLKKEPVRYMRGEGDTDPFMASFAEWLATQGSPLEAELSLDQRRWEMLEELKKGHYFDIDFLIIYALQLQILERWQRINSGNGIEILYGLLEKEIA